MIEIRSLNVVTSCIRTVSLRVRFVKLGCPLELVLVVSEICAGRYGAGSVGEGQHETPRKACGLIRSRCRRGSGGSGNNVSEQTYFLALPRLESACVALIGTRMVCLSGCRVSLTNLSRSRHERNLLNIKAKRVG